MNDDLRKWRETAHISQADAARALGVSPAFLCRLERGVVRPNLRHLSRLGRMYAVAPDVLGRAVLRMARDAKGAA